MTLKIHISDHNDDLHNTTAKRNLAGGVVGLNSISKIDNLYLTLPFLTEALFRTNPATGTSVQPQRINDISVIHPQYFSAIGQTVEIDFTHEYLMKEYRVYGVNANNGTGRCDLQYQNMQGVYVNIAVISTKSTLGWSDWISLPHMIYTQKIKMIATAIDTAYNESYCREMQMRG